MLDLYHPSFQGGFPRQLGVFIGASAIELLKAWQRPISPYFQKILSHIADYSNQYDIYGDKVAKQVYDQYDYAWTFKTTLEHPLKRQKRIGQLTPTKSYKEITDSMMGHLPKNFDLPF